MVNPLDLLRDHGNSSHFREEVEWCDIEWTDNSECLDLVEKNMGIMSLINEESRFPKGTDQSLLNKMHSQHQVRDSTMSTTSIVSKLCAGETLNVICEGK